MLVFYLMNWVFKHCVWGSTCFVSPGKHWVIGSIVTGIHSFIYVMCLHYRYQLLLVQQTATGDRNYCPFSISKRNYRRSMGMDIHTDESN